MKRAIIIHCWDGYPNYCWYQQTKKELEDKGFMVDVPEMPETEEPKLALWLPVLESMIQKPDKDLYLIGHSIGCATILRYLEKLAEDQKVGGVVLVAGFTDNLGFKELKNFFQSPLNLNYIQNKSKHFVAIHSDNDTYVDLKYADIFKEKLQAKVIIKHAMNHFSGDKDAEEACVSLPDVAQSIKEMTN